MAPREFVLCHHQLGRVRHPLVRHKTSIQIDIGVPRGSRFVKIAEGLGVDMLHRICYRLLSDSHLPHVVSLLELLLTRL